MAYPWTQHDIDALRKVANPGMTVADIADVFNHVKGVRRRSAKAIEVQLRISMGKRRSYWAQDENELLLTMAGRATVQEIKAALLSECGTDRSLNAIYHHFKMNDLSADPSPEAWLSVGHIGRFLGVRHQAVIALCEEGLLRCERFGGGKYSKRRIRPAWFDELIDREPPRFNVAMMPPSRFRSRVELRQREGRFLTIQQASSITHIHVLDMYRACNSGSLPAFRARRVGDFGLPRWWIRANDLMRWHQQSTLERAA